MNGFGLFAANEALRLANERMAELRREADGRRMIAATPRNGLTARIAAAVSNVKATFTSVDRDFNSLPSLSDYPYRS